MRNFFNRPDYTFIASSGKRVLLPGLLLLLVSCSFNGQFLNPDPIPAHVKQVRMINHEIHDTITIHLGPNFQPVFTRGKNDTVDYDYEIESVLFDRGDGKKLHGWIIWPEEGFNGINVLFLHGNGGNVLSQYQGIIPFVRKGFRVFIFDYSGYGYSEGTATRKQVVKDGDTAFDFFHSKYDGKFLLYGQSLGGHLSAVVAEMNENDSDGLIIEGAFSSHKDIARHNAGIAGRILVSENYSAKESIKKYNQPVLVIHSTDDDVIPFEMGKTLFNSANDPKYFYEIDRCHICGPVFYSDSIAHKMLIVAGIRP